MGFLRYAASLLLLAAGTLCADAGGFTSGDRADSLGTSQKTDVTAVAKPRGRMAYNGFFGGMMLHTGYLSAGNVSYTMSGGSATRDVRMAGVPFGIGGAIRFVFGNHLRVGGEGAVSTVKYGQYKSTARMSYGGFLADCFWTAGRWRIFVGGLLGGGSQTNMLLLDDPKDDFVTEDGTAAYRKFTYFLFSPFVGTEFAVSQKINIVLKADYMLTPVRHQSDFMAGPRLYIGFMFGHTK
ncbi:MAG: hypothetical protein ACI395_05525 [Candidatus Cryptobacteroides sp.]